MVILFLILGFVLGCVFTVNVIELNSQNNLICTCGLTYEVDSYGLPSDLYCKNCGRPHMTKEQFEDMYRNKGLDVKC